MPMSTLTGSMLLPPLGAMQQNVLWRRRRNWSRARLKPCSPWVIIKYWVQHDYGAAKITFGRVGKMLPSSSEIPMPLGLLARREGQCDQSIAYWEQAVALDRRNLDLRNGAAHTYSMRRHFPAVLKLTHRAQ